MNRVGERLGNYRLVHFLGQGGTAEVYLAEHIFLKTMTAIKVLSVQLSSRELEQFLHEARIIAGLDHPNIIRILEFGIEGGDAISDTGELNRTGGTPYLVMEYAPNGTLRGQFPRGTRVPLAVLLSYVRQVAGALQYAHDRRLIHRDIKPENLLLGRNNEVLISDFGIAVVSQNSQLERTQEVVGTIGYMSPEQLQGKPRPASDQYALGVIVYEWLCGERPFSGSFIDLFAQHLQTPPPPLHLKLPGIPPEVEAVVMKALAKNWQERFATISLFAGALEQVCSPYVSPATGSLPGISTRATTPLSRPLLPPLTPGISGETGSGTSNTPPLTMPVTPPFSGPAPIAGIGHVRDATTFSSTTQADMAGRVSASFKQGMSVEALQQGRSLGADESALGAINLAPGSADQSALGAINRPLRKSGHEVAGEGKRKVSRRAALITLGMAGVAAVGGITAWQLLSHQPRQTGGSPPTPTTTIAVAETLFTYTGHTLDVYGVAWSPSGLLIASVGQDMTVQVCDARTGARRFSYTGHKGSTNGLAWLPEAGTRIASASSDMTVQVWDALSGEHVLIYKGHNAFVRSVTWSPDGKYIASAGDDKVVRVWDAASGKTIFTYDGHTDLIWFLRWSPDGTRIASASKDRTAHVIDAGTGARILIYSKHTRGVQALAWSPDSSRVVSASSDKTAQVWDAGSGATKLIYRGHPDSVQGVDWATDGRSIATCSSNAQVWDATTGKRILNYNQPPLIHGVAWSPDSTRVASVGVDTTMRVWQVSTSR
ncbi:MAG TPA: serine/threonine-protein kinase [Ktedonobacteraceae bacterium]|nr:serine/threonine-protein kinase [Ktedonobacteraceae bacterium]